MNPAGVIKKISNDILKKILERYFAFAEKAYRRWQLHR